MSGIVKLFEQSRLPVTDLPALHVVLQNAAVACANGLRDLAGIEATITVKRIERMPLNTAMAKHAGNICSLFLLPEWNAQGVIGFSSSLLFRVLDAMYGGDGKQSGSEPGRPLTQLDQKVAGQVASMFFDQVQHALRPFVDFATRLVSTEQLTDASMYEKNSTEFALLHLWLVEIDETLFIALPLKGLELARDQLTSVNDEAAHDLDPNWRRLFRKSIVSTQVELEASCEGPPMLLGDIARLRAGSLIEFDGAALDRVRLDADGDRVYEGRLGQTRGYFTVCLEAPLAAQPASEDHQVLAQPSGV